VAETMSSNAEGVGSVPAPVAKIPTCLMAKIPKKKKTLSQLTGVAYSKAGSYEPDN